MTNTPAAPIATLAVDAIRNALDGGAQYRAVDRAVYAHNPLDDSARDETVTAVDALLRTGYITVTPTVSPDPAALLADNARLRAELAQARAAELIEAAADFDQLADQAEAKAAARFPEVGADGACDMLRDAANLLRNRAAIITADTAPACTCRAVPVHQNGCDSDGTQPPAGQHGPITAEWTGDITHSNDDAEPSTIHLFDVDHPTRDVLLQISLDNCEVLGSMLLDPPGPLDDDGIPLAESNPDPA